MAARFGHKDIVEYLIKKKAHIDTKDKNEVSVEILGNQSNTLMI